MKKETTVAIFFGILLGAVIAVSLIIKNRQAQLQKAKTIVPEIKTAFKITPNAINARLLEIVSPDDGMITAKNTVTIRGKTDPNSLLIIQSPLKDVVVRNDKADFTIDFPLALGENIITIAVYAKEPQLRSQEKQLKIYYLDEL
ncbi:hypothetical protein HY214_04480 [Candidatus Roizmanbacteria bacterium]|nr:hypothetical protein [Candidatus Roizmanbacteria bacterium]